MIAPLVVPTAPGAEKRTLTVHVAPGGSNDPPTQVPPPWIANCPGDAVIESSDTDVRPVLRTVVASTRLVLAAIVPKSSGSIVKPGSRRRVNAWLPESDSSLIPSRADPESEIHATQRPFPDSAGW